MRKKRLSTLLVAVAMLLGCFTLPVLAEEDTTPPIGELVSSVSIGEPRAVTTWGDTMTVEVRLADGVSGVTSVWAGWSHTIDCQPHVLSTELTPVPGDEGLLRGVYEISPATVTVTGDYGYLEVSSLTIGREDGSVVDYNWEDLALLNLYRGFYVVENLYNVPTDITTSFPYGTEFTSYETGGDNGNIVVRTNTMRTEGGIAYFHDENGAEAFQVTLWGQNQPTGNCIGWMELGASWDREAIPNGTYTLARLEIECGGQTYVYALDPAAGEMQMTAAMSGVITVNVPQDTTPPEVVPGSVLFEVDEELGVIHAWVQVRDMLSGVGNVRLVLQREGVDTWPTYYIMNGGGVPDVILDFQLPIDHFIPGDYILYSLEASDAAGNQVTYSGDELVPLLANPAERGFTLAGEWFEGYEEPQDITIDYPWGNVFTEYSSNITNVTVYTNWKYATQIGLTYMDDAGNTFTARLPVGSLSEPGKLTGWLDYTYTSAAGKVAPNGEYRIVAMRLLGLKDGKDVYYDYNLNPGAGELPLPATLAAAAVTLDLPEDNTAPEVDAGSFKGNRAGQTVRPLTQMTFTLTARDDISGVGQAIATFKGPGNASIEAYLGAGYNQNQMTGSFYIENARHANGTYTLDRLLVRDYAGNERIYTGAALQGLLASPQDGVFTVEGADIDYVVTPDDNLADELEKLLEKYEGSDETPVLLIQTADAEKSVLPSGFFKAAAGKDVEIRIALEAEGLYGTYLVFEGQGIDAGKAIDMELGLTLGDPKAYSFIPADNTTSHVLVFPDNGVLPGTATLLVPAYNSTKAMNLYFHDVVAGKLVLEAEGLKAQDGYYHVPITHNSTFVFTDVLLDGPTPGPGPDEGNQKANPSSGVKLRVE